MPLYEYRCKSCGHEFEIQQSISEDTLTICPNCDLPELKKVFQPVGISFKGSGFYKNDSRSGSGSKSSSTSSSTSSSSSSSSGASDSGSTSSESSVSSGSGSAKSD